MKKSDQVRETLIDYIKDLPRLPGVYLMKNEVEKILYVGKAKDLRARVRSYFTDSKDHSPKTRLLVQQIRSIDTIQTRTEVEAFLLEASLIKKHRPRYNIRLKDDKSYPYIRVSMADRFPRMYLARKVIKDGSVYFGPYTSGQTVFGTMRFLNQMFAIRDCRDAFMAVRKRPCMTHQIGRCTAPCVDLVSAEEYHQQVKSALDFLRGRDKKLLKDLKKQMLDASDAERFEAAARLRDSIDALKKVQERQAVINDSAEDDQDVIAFIGDQRGTLIETLHVRAGRVISTRGQFISTLDPTDADEDPRDWLTSFINQYYDEALVPDEVLLPVDLGRDLHLLLEELLLERSGRKVRVRFATDRVGQNLLEMATVNAQKHFEDNVTKSAAKKAALEEIQSRLQLPHLPERIECFDISTFQGKETVASQVVFEEGVPNKDHYRRYRIKTVVGTDDFASMKEVLTRRLKHNEMPVPQLIVIDGGKGQLKSATEVLKELGREEIPVVGLAKSRVESEFTSAELKTTEERFYLPGRQNPVVFKTNSEAFKILTGIRDEAHRFAITYHRKLREATSLESELDQIPNLGPVRKKALLKVFSSVIEIRNATLTEIINIPGFSKNLALQLMEELGGAGVDYSQGSEADDDQ